MYLSPSETFVTARYKYPPEGGEVDYCLFGGIVRDVWLIATGECYIDNTFVSNKNSFFFVTFVKNKMPSVP